MSDPLTGGCNCGAVRFEITEPLLSRRYCHCTRCQRRTGHRRVGQRARSRRARSGSSHGEDRLRAWKPEGGAEKCFCGDCGSALFTRDPEARRGSASGSARLDGDPGIRPSARQFVAYAAPWEPIPDDGLPRYPREPATGPCRPPGARPARRAIHSQPADEILDAHRGGDVEPHPVAEELVDPLAVGARRAARRGPPGARSRRGRGRGSPRRRRPRRPGAGASGSRGLIGELST